MIKASHIFFVVYLLCIGCTPAWLDYDNIASDWQINRSLMKVKNFTIALYSNRAFVIKNESELIHIYFDGDGSPWRNRGLSINDDPTPRQPLVLHLMSLDPVPSILIGRPCYHGFSTEDNCHSALWTHQRYSEEVVTIMSEALNIILKNREKTMVILIGYSGGGTLALLLAERVPQTNILITLAGNLDTAGWVQLHGYSPLEGSLNPVERPLLPSRILQIHYVGRSDKNVPPYLVESYVSKKKQGEIIILEKVDHYNGWLENWPDLLIYINKRLATQ